MDAAEYVLGTLDAGERAAFAERLRGDGDEARQAVAAWERRLSDLADRTGDIAPDAHVWSGIESALRAPSAKPLAFRVIDGGGRAPTQPAAVSYRASRNRWRIAAVSSAAVAAGLVGLIADREMTRPAAPSGDFTYLAAVNRGGDKPALLIRVDLKTRQVYVRPVAAETPSGKSLELWYIGDNKPPRPMGLVDQTAATLPIPVGAAGARATFAVSVEPPGGSPTDSPTGPVLYSGELVKAAD